ncbi:hypothetical protein RI367_005544 [Sorochytrium milnesiophthora]
MPISDDVLAAAAAASTSNIAKGSSVEQRLASATHLCLASRKISKIDKLDRCVQLSVLYLYDNNISRIQGLWELRNLTRLYLQNNQISAIQGLDGLDKLEVLHLSNNCIRTLENLSLPSLVTLQMDNQRLPPSVAFEIDAATINLSRLESLSLSSVRLHNMKPLATLFSVRTLNVSGNNINDARDVEFVLRNLCDLHSLQMSGNAVTKTPKFRDRVVMASESLESLDGRDIQANERAFLASLHRRRAERASSLSSLQESAVASADGARRGRSLASLSNVDVVRDLQIEGAGTSIRKAKPPPLTGSKKAGLTPLSVVKDGIGMLEGGLAGKTLGRAHQPLPGVGQQPEAPSRQSSSGASRQWSPSVNAAATTASAGGGGDTRAEIKLFAFDSPDLDGVDKNNNDKVVAVVAEGG